MPAGIQILNSSGTIQIDENYRNLMLRYSGSRSNTNTFTLNNLNLPLVAFRSTAGVNAVYGGSLGNGSGFFGQLNTGSTNYYIFDILPSIPSSSNYGLVIYNASGQPVFDALGKPMRFISHHRYTTASEWEGATINTPSGRTCAVIFGGTGVLYEDTYTGSTGAEGSERFRKISRVGATTSSTQITLGRMTTQSEYYIDPEGGRVDTIWERPHVDVTVVDVTGY